MIDTAPEVPTHVVRRGRPYQVGDPFRIPDFSAYAASRGRCGEPTGPWAVYVYPTWPGSSGTGVRHLVDELEARGFRPAEP